MEREREEEEGRRSKDKKVDKEGKMLVGIFRGNREDLQ